MHPYLCISAAELQIPFHSSSSRPVKVREMRNRGRETSEVRSLTGGNLALADFHVTPPLGSNISRRTRAVWRDTTIERMGYAMGMERKRKRKRKRKGEGRRAEGENYLSCRDCLLSSMISTGLLFFLVIERSTPTPTGNLLECRALPAWFKEVARK